MSNGIFCKRSLEDNFVAVKELGFENFEFNMKSVETEDDTAVYEARRLFDAFGLKCLTVHAATLHVKDVVEIHRAVYYGKISAVFASMLSAPVMVVHSNVSRKLPGDLRKEVMGRIFRELTPFAMSLNVKLSLENLSYASTGFGKNVAELEEILGIIDEDEAMGVTLDFCHAEATGQTFKLLEKYHKRLCNIHMSNRTHKPFNETPPSLKAFISKLREYDYNGPVTLELNRKCTTSEILETKNIVGKIVKR